MSCAYAKAHHVLQTGTIMSSVDAIVFFGDDDEPTDMTADRYELEEYLEEHLVASPTLLAGAQMTPDEEPRRWLLVRRQYPIRGEDGSTWAVDIMFLDQEGMPTLVEVKRADNRELRRTVVGQVLDYAAGVRYGAPEKIRTEYETRTGTVGETSNELLEHIGAGHDPEEFWAAVANNVIEGRIRMVFAADEIPSVLQGIVEYLNEQLRTAQVFALAVVQYVGRDGNRVLVPRLAGATAAARATKNAGRGAVGPGYETLLAGADDLVRKSAELLEDWANTTGAVGKTTASARIFAAPDGRTLCRLYPKPGCSYLEVDLKAARELGGNEEADALLARIHSLNPERKLGGGGLLPSIACADVSAKWSAVESVMNELLDLRRRLTAG